MISVDIVHIATSIPTLQNPAAVRKIAFYVLNSIQNNVLPQLYFVLTVKVPMKQMAGLYPITIVK